MKAATEECNNARTGSGKKGTARWNVDLRKFINEKKSLKEAHPLYKEK